MATSFKIVVRQDEINTSGQCRIKIRVSHNGQTRYIPTDYYIDPLLVTDVGQISPKYPGATKLNLRLNGIVAGYMEKILTLGDRLEDYTGQQLVEFLRAKPKDGDLFAYAREVISQLSVTGHTSVVVFPNLSRYLDVI